MRISDWSSDVCSSDLPDLVGFGRRELGATPAQIHDDVLYQLGALDGICRAEDTRVRYLRPHGAPSHRCAMDPAAAEPAIAARSEERRVGKSGVSTCRSWRAPAT